MLHFLALERYALVVLRSAWRFGQTSTSAIAQLDRCNAQLINAPGASVTSSNSAVASAWVSGQTLYVHGNSYGSALITVQSGGFTTSFTVQVQGV